MRTEDILGILLYIAIGLILVFGTYCLVRNERKRKRARGEVDDRLSKVDGFTPTKLYKGQEGLYIFALDDVRRKLLYIIRDVTEMIDYKDIASVELKENDKLLMSLAPGLTLGEEVVEGMLTKDKHPTNASVVLNNYVSTVDINLYANDSNVPLMSVRCFDSKAMCDSDQIQKRSLTGLQYYAPSLAQAQDIMYSMKQIFSVDDNNKQ